MAAEIAFATTEQQILDCFAALQVLRPHLRDQAAFLAQVRRQQQAGYQLVALADEGEVRSAAGFRLLEFLAWGQVLYVDDLVTLPAGRRRGYAGSLLDWLIGYARTQGCAAVHLDSGYQRHEAHRLYLARGFQLACHHLALLLDP